MAPRSFPAAPALPTVAEAPEPAEAHPPPALRRRAAPPAPKALEAPAAPARARPRPPPPRPRLSDLDIQIAHGSECGAAAARPPGPPGGGRYGRVIPDTVDSWARRTVLVRDGAFKPLVFGGTYPIEVPASPEERPARPPVAEVRATVDRAANRRELRRTIERSLDRFDAILARRGAPTFAVDAPLAPLARAPAPADYFFGCPLALRDVYHFDVI